MLVKRDRSPLSFTAFRKLILLLLALGMLSQTAAPVEQDLSKVDFTFEQFSTEDGLSSNLLRFILQDRQGYMWFGTEHGLNKFDGYTFTVYQYDPESPFALSSSDTSDLWEDEDGILWIGTYKGLNRLDPKTGAIRYYVHDPSNPNSLSDERITFLVPDRDHNLWIGTRAGGLNFFDRKKETFQTFRHDPATDSIESDKLVAFAVEPSGSFLIATQAMTLERFDPVTRKFTCLFGGRSSPLNILRIRLEGDSVAWCGTWEQGLLRLDLRTGESKQYLHDAGNPFSMGCNIVHDLIRGDDGRYWIGTATDGINLFDPAGETFRHVKSVPYGKPDVDKANVLCLYRDRAGGIWFGTSDNGLFRYDPYNQRFGHLMHNPAVSGGLNENQIYSLSADAQGRIWIGTDGGGLNGYDPIHHTFRYYTHDPSRPEGLDGNTVVSLLSSRDGSLWIGYWFGGISRFDPETERFEHSRENLDDPNGFHGNTVRALCEDYTGAVWIGTENQGLNVRDPQTGAFRHYKYNPSVPNSLSDKYVRCLYEDRRKNMWIGTIGFGLNRYDRENDCFVSYGSDPRDRASLSGNTVTSICEDSGGRMWFGTNEGLSLLNPDGKTFRRYSTKDGLPSNLVKSVAEDAFRNLWISTDQGISRFSPARGEFQNFDRSDGLQGLSFTIGSVCKSPDGKIYFGGMSGLNWIDPNNIQRNPFAPPVVVTVFKVLGQPVDWESRLNRDGRILLEYRQNFLQFEFAALSFNRAGKNRYRYRLAGLEEDWQDSGSRRFVQYTTLRPGDYVFNVRGSNNDGTWNEQGVSIPIRITPPFWETAAFRAAVGLLAAALIAGLHHLRVRSVENRRRQLALEVKRQTAQLRSQSEQLETVNRELEKLSFLDGLTNIANRRRFEEHLDSEWKRGMRNKTPLSLILMDIDFFKKFNDAYGHPAGDDCLRRVAEAVRLCGRRPGDLAARYGGEEFALLLADTDADNAWRLAETVRQKVEDLRIPHEHSSAHSVVSISLGVVTSVPHPDSSPLELIRLADQALYRAKQEGRNRVVQQESPSLETI